MSIRLSKSEAAKLGIKPARASRSPVNHKEFKSGLERRYAEVLESEKILGLLISWRYEHHRLHLGGGAWYKPDFLVIRNNSGPFQTEYHETKGYWRTADKLRLKVAISQNEHAAFYVVTADGKGFNVERWSK